MEYTWEKLVVEISEMYISGLGEVEISSNLAGSVLVGTGVIERIETDASVAAPFIQLNMPRVEVQHNEKVFVADFLALNFNELYPLRVKHLSKGANISFKTTIIKSNGPFPGISISECEDEKEILIMPGTQDSEIA